jgi:hypothetical protein
VSTEAIRTAIFTRVQTVAASVPVAWPGVNFDPVPLWWDVAIVPNEPERLFVGAGARWRGFLLIGVMAQPQQPWGSAATAAAGFPQDLKLTSGGVTVRFTRPAHTQQPFRDGPHWRIPVTAPFEALIL